MKATDDLPFLATGPDFIAWRYVIHKRLNRVGRVLNEFPYAVYVESPFFGEALWANESIRNPTGEEAKKIMDSFYGAKEAKRNIDHSALDDLLGKIK